MSTQNIENSVVSEVERASSASTELEKAYQRRLAEIRAVPKDEIGPTNLEIPACVVTILGVLPKIRALRTELAKMQHLDQELLDALEDYARATAEAHSRYTVAITTKADIIELNAAAMKVRNVLRADCHALATRGLIDPRRLRVFKGFFGYKLVAFELLDYANLLTQCWPAIAGKTALTREEVEVAKELGARLVRAAGLRERAPRAKAEAALIRQQALTLLVRAYNEARRGVHLLRSREGDANTIAPSLYKGRGGRRRVARESREKVDDQPGSHAPELPPH